MKDIIVYDFDFNKKVILTNVQSINYTLYYNAVGTAELHMYINPFLMALLNNNTPLVMVHDDIQWIVTGYKVNINELIVFGRTLNHLFTKRIVVPFVTVDILNPNGMDAQSLVRKLLTESYLLDRTEYWTGKGNNAKIYDDNHSAVTLKKVDNFVLGEPISGTFTPKAYRRDTVHDLMTLVKEYLDYIAAGHQLYFDIPNRRWVFKAWLGNEIPIVISDDNRTGSDFEKTYEAQDAFNCGIYSKDESEDTPLEYYYYGGKYDDTIPTILRQEASLSGKTEAEARKSMATKYAKDTLKASVYRLQYGRDYKLGDILTFQFNYGGVDFTNKMYVKAVSIAWDKDIYTCTPTLASLDDRTIDEESDKDGN